MAITVELLVGYSDPEQKPSQPLSNSLNDRIKAGRLVRRSMRIRLGDGLRQYEEAAGCKNKHGPLSRDRTKCVGEGRCLV